MEEICLTIVHPANIEANWAELGPWILLAVGDDANAWDVEYIKNQSKVGAAQIWVAKTTKIEAVLVTEAVFHGGRKSLVLRWLAGVDSHQWIGVLDFIENWAVNNGYERIEAWGRKGFEKLLRPFGYSHDFSVVGKSLIRRLQ